MTDRRREGRERLWWRPVSKLHYDRRREGRERLWWRPVSKLHYDRRREGVGRGGGI